MTISLFTGAGGLDYGLEAAGFQTRVAIELDPQSCETLTTNRPQWGIIRDSIFDVPSEHILARAGMMAGEVDLVAGGPPCQPFSKAGNWARANGRAPGLTDARSDTLSAFMRVVADVRPRAVLLENVEGLAEGGDDSGLGFVNAQFAAINERIGTRYCPSFAVLDAADYGVPQSRRRLFVVAARDGGQFRFPHATHGSSNGQEPYLTAWDALGSGIPDESDLELHGKWAALLPSIPEGKNYLWHTGRGGGESIFGWRRRYWTFLLKLSKKLPSWTIQAHPGPAAGPFHWNNRKLAISELCRLQTFPRDVRITGGRTAAHRQVGNAVPSLLAEVLGREIRAQLLGHAVTEPLVLLPDRRLPVPRARATRSVPPKYHHLIGNHRAHPGTGKGPGAKRRAKVPVVEAKRSGAA
jgi:DNA (cytosine-5)-methyltransferase 1